MEKKIKTVFITGASRGLGFALTQKFISKHWAVVSLVRRKKDAARLKEIGCGHCFSILSDVTIDDVQASMQGLLKSFGNIDVLINNAGTGGNSDTFAQTTADEVRSLLNIHCLGVLRVTQAVLPFMNKDGTIINISSRFGSITKIETGQLDDISCSYSYRISKAAQNMLTQCMCREFKNSKMKICSIHPSRLQTDSASTDADRTPGEAAEILYEKLKNIEHGKFYSLFNGTIEW
jgi:NAD(P)-dependent dehydrogenase (short-subunit alcohol dehydrogenase family)